MVSPESMAGSSLIEIALGEIWGAVRKLLDSKIVIRQGATIYHEENEIEYQLHLSIGDIQTRTSSIEKVIQSLSLSEITIKGALNAWGSGLPYNENLEELGVIKRRAEGMTVSFQELLRKVRSNLVIISVRKKLPEGLRDHLVTIHFSQNTKTIGSIKEAYFEILLDYANLWHKSLESFRIRNVVLTFNLEVIEGTIENFVPEDFKSKLRVAAQSLAGGDRNAVRFFNEVTKAFIQFESETVISRLRTMVKAEPPTRVEVLEIIPRMEHYQIAGVSYPVMLPGRVTTKLRTGIEENEFSALGKVVIDLGIFNEIIRGILRKLEIDTRDMKF
jgi:hypothetical protein